MQQWQKLEESSYQKSVHVWSFARQTEKLQKHQTVDKKSKVRGHEGALQQQLQPDGNSFNLLTFTVTMFPVHSPVCVWNATEEKEQCETHRNDSYDF